MAYKYLPAQKIIDSLTHKMSGIRTGRVTPALLDTVLIDAYGSKLSVKEVATITVPEPAQLLITPFDKSLNQALEKGLRDANLGANPVNDGAGIRLSFPPMTEENRKQRVKEVGIHLEEAKIVLRNHRQDILKSQKAAKENGEITEDDLKRFEVELQKEVDQLNKDLEEIAKNKEQEILKF
jgi:ribosome recycling factor